jgi:small multidrug resistance family-3 protein
MNPKIFLFLIAAAALETVGDAIVRNGISESAWLPRSALFLAGAALLFGYGFCLNLAPVEFGRVVGLYIATLFVMWQITNLIFYGSLPSTRVLIGGALIIAGGLIVTAAPQESIDLPTTVKTTILPLPQSSAFSES